MLNTIAFPKSAMIFWENIVKESKYLNENLCFQKFLIKLEVFQLIYSLLLTLYCFFV